MVSSLVEEALKMRDECVVLEALLSGAEIKVADNVYRLVDGALINSDNRNPVFCPMTVRNLVGFTKWVNVKFLRQVIKEEASNASE